MGEFLSQAPVTFLSIDLRTLKYGGAPAEIAPSGTPVYEILVYRVLGRTSQFLLQVGQASYPVRGQGDRLHFASGMDRGAFLKLPRWANVNPGGSGVGIVELALVHEPDVTLNIPQTDPWALARLVSAQASVTVAAGVQPFISLCNLFNPVAPLALTNAKVLARLRRWIATLSIDGLVQIQNGSLNAPVAGAGFGDNDIVIDSATPGPIVCTLAARQLDASNGNIRGFGLKASQAFLLPVETDIWPSITNNVLNAVGVLGPVGGGCTMTVTAEWHELELLVGGSQ